MHHFNLPLIFLLLFFAWTTHAQDPVAADDFSQRGITRFEQNDLEGAFADFSKGIELHGQQLEFCFYFRCIALYRRCRLDEAIADLSKAITLKRHPRFYADHGNMLAQKGESHFYLWYTSIVPSYSVLPTPSLPSTFSGRVMTLYLPSVSLFSSLVHTTRRLQPPPLESTLSQYSISTRQLTAASTPPLDALGALTAAELLRFDESVDFFAS